MKIRYAHPFTFLVLAVAFAAAHRAHADSIKLGTLWIENVTIDSFDGNELHYLVAGVANKQYLTKIDGFKMSTYPQLEEAEKALTAGKTKEVLAAMKAVRGKAKEPWLRMWLDSRLVPLMDKEGENLGAINTYIALIDAKAPASFLEDPPVKAVKALAKDDKAKVHEKLTTVRKAAKDKTPLADALDELLSASEPGDAATPPTGAEAESLIPMPETLIKDKPDVITKLLMRGRYDQALERISEEMKSAAGGGKTSLLLYQRGIAQFYLAEAMEKDPAKKAEARQLFEDAGLSFYRVPIYFKSSAMVSAALMETAAVHLKINRPDVAKGLLDLASNGIDPDDKPMHTRLEALKALAAAATSASK